LKKKESVEKALPLWAEQASRGFREIAMILLFFVSIYLMVALVSFNPQDPGWTNLGSTKQVYNAGGPAGAWFADVLMSLFGYLAYLFPLSVIYRTWLVIKNRDSTPFDWPIFILRSAGFLLTMFSIAGLAYLHFDVVKGSLPAIDAMGRNPAGGIIGVEIGATALDLFSSVGATLLLLALFFMGLTIFGDISWLHVMDTVGGYTLHGLAWLSDQKDCWQDRIVAYRERQKLKKAGPAVQGFSISKAKAKTKPIIKEKRVAPTISEPDVIPKPTKISKIIKNPLKAKQQKSLFDNPVSGDLPAVVLLDAVDNHNKKGFSREKLESMSHLLEVKLLDFGIEVVVENVLPGPVVTRFEIQPAAGIKVSRITNLAKDLARSLAVISVRVVEVIPGKTVVGIEIPNEDRELIRLSEIIASKPFEDSPSPLTLALGKDIAGHSIVADLGKMPHLLVAGTTGSGKSVGLNAMLLSMLFKSTPEKLRLIMIDPKMLELAVYDGIPHLLTPVVTDMKEAANALRWSVAEMERRYRLMATMGVRNLAGYNKKIQDANKRGEPIKDPFFQPTEFEKEAPDLVELPCIVVVVDEFADMMMIVGKKVEELIARIAQKARAAGIHLILATQRPSVDVITGLIKANVPSRIGFQVSSKIDSRTILDQGGAEQLLGHGDMLYLPPGTSLPIRVHGAFVDDDEVHRVCDDWRQRGDPNYLEEILDGTSEGGTLPGESSGEEDAEMDVLYDQAVQIVTESRRASISSVQRRLKIGYNRAARMIESMEAAGVVTEMQSNGSREVLAPSPPK